MYRKMLNLPSSWERLAESTKPIILYGTGNGADKVIDEAQRLGIKIDGVCASDGFVRKRTFRSFEVRSLAQCEEIYGDFIVALGFASSIDSVMDNIYSLNERQEVVVPVVPVFGETLFNREYVEKNADLLWQCRELLADEESKRVFDNFVYFHYTGSLSYLKKSESSRAAALKEILMLTDEENMLDLGAYRGDTIQELENVCGGFSSALAFEPDIKSFRKLTQASLNDSRISALPYAVWDCDAELSFEGGGGRQSTLSANGRTSVRAVAVDDVVGEREFSYVKIDVEGAEKRAILGMANLLQRDKPRLSVAVYHRTEDLVTLIPLIKKLVPNYEIYLRHHPYIPFWDTNIYCK